MNAGAGTIRAAAITAAVTSLLTITTTPALAQEGDAAQPQDSTAREQPRYLLTPITVTATAKPIELFDVPKPITVLDQTVIEEKLPNNAADLFRNEQGLDVTGVGANQVRPSIRGQRGQRIIVVQDGMRLNNARRQKDFGEIPALIDISQIQRIEVVRGPASILYGSDAIGGAVNLVTKTPEREGVNGTLGYRFSTYDSQSRIVGRFFGRSGRLGYQVGGMYRNTDSYDAPSGSFGDITLTDDTRVNDTGVEDYSLDLLGSYDFSARHQVFAKYERYSADDAGFGFVDPQAYAPDQPLIQITYPRQ
jgi:outer membrane receptor protein involved in Fe transport